jgi:hypothetical protein
VNDINKVTAWVAGFFLFIMVIAAWSRLSQLPTTPATINAAGNGFSNLFRGVLQ